MVKKKGGKGLVNGPAGRVPGHHVPRRRALALMARAMAPLQHPRAIASTAPAMDAQPPPNRDSTASKAAHEHANTMAPAFSPCTARVMARRIACLVMTCMRVTGTGL
nr:hypothetical protein [Candidatus Sigynarchaeota archaeon]